MRPPSNWKSTVDFKSPKKVNFKKLTKIETTSASSTYYRGFSTKKGEYIIRISDHWGNVAGNTWTLDGASPDNGSFVGKAYLKDYIYNKIYDAGWDLILKFEKKHKSGAEIDGDDVDELFEGLNFINNEQGWTFLLNLKTDREFEEYARYSINQSKSSGEMRDNLLNKNKKILEKSLKV